MAKRKSYSEICETFSDLGYELLTEECDYKNNKTILQFTCVKHESIGLQTSDWASFQRGKNRCKACKEEDKKPRSRFSIEKAAELFNSKGLTLIEGQSYTNKKLPLKFICLEHPSLIQQIPLLTLENPNSIGCRLCDKNKRVEMQLIPFKDVKSLFQSKGYTLLSLESDYKNSKEALDYTCNKHPNKKQAINYNNLHNCHGCKFCDIERKTGETSPTWRCGITAKNLSVRTSKEYNNWRLTVFMRDGFTCQCCESTKSIQAHHLLSFSTHVELRFDVNNGVTLCEKCHDNRFEGSFHRIYGTKNNTPEQFYEFKSMKLAEMNATQQAI